MKTLSVIFIILLTTKAYCQCPEPPEIFANMTEATLYCIGDDCCLDKDCISETEYSKAAVWNTINAWQEEHNLITDILAGINYDECHSGGYTLYYKNQNKNFLCFKLTTLSLKDNCNDIIAQKTEFAWLFGLSGIICATIFIIAMTF